MKIKNIIKNNPHFYGGLALIIPAIIVLSAYIGMGVFPFGDRAAMIIDSYHQYVPFFSELHYKIWHNESVLYSWHGSLGFNYLAVQAYYLASPLNLLVALFPASMMIEAFEFMIILKICLSSLTAYEYLRFRTGKKEYATVIFACFYALGGFTVAYNWNVMWLDSIVLFPLVLLGIEWLINRKEGLFYTVVMGITIFCNYYMAIMICIFAVLYYFVVWFSHKRSGIKEFFITGCRFAGCSLLAGGMAAIYLVPTYYTLINSSQGSEPSEFKLYRNFLEVFRQQFALVEPTELTGAPNIYCGILLSMLVVFYIAAKNIRWREKFARLLVTVFVLVSLNVNVLDYIWHGFHFPNNLPGRFSFIYIFMVVVMAYDAWNGIRSINWKLYAVFFTAEIVLFGVCVWYPEKRLPVYSMAVTGAFMAVYIALLIAYKRRSFLKVKGRIVRPKHILLMLLTVELAANAIFGLCMNGSVSRTSYTEDRQEIADIRKKYAPQDTFYRMELAQIRGRDDITWHNLNGMSFFSSTADDRLEKLMGALGFFNSGNKYSYKGATPLTDAMLDIRYLISNKEVNASNLALIEETENKYIYENMQNLAVGYMVNLDILNWKIAEGEPFMLQNDFVRMATDTDEALFTPIPVSEPEITGGELTESGGDKYYYNRKESDGHLLWQLTFEEQQDVYLYFEASHCKNLKVVIDGESQTYSDEKGHIVYLGPCDAAKVVTLEFPMDDSYKSGNVKLQLYAYHEEVFKKAYEQLAAEQLNVTSFDSNHITGNIDVQEQGILLFSIPYDQGWTILVDGEPADAEAIGEAMMGIEISKGIHHISLKYVPQGFKSGALISAICVLFVLIVLYIKSKKYHKGDSLL